MAKNMARIKNGIVTNIEWCADLALETDGLKNVYDLPVEVGDSYSEGKFYHSGEVVLSALETVQKENTELSSQIENLIDAMAQLVEDVYTQDAEQDTV